ncbi:MAG: hypothetical protein A2516_00330 [Alphaproteobacteria bacterium RIFOXYD12_FULL_60_8]|nr:MAG: hypothetical protein A2516_00330 [Alphaproteobacteria bacterium RIFOXYD12_FULL_60_8]
MSKLPSPLYACRSSNCDDVCAHHAVDLRLHPKGGVVCENCWVSEDGYPLWSDLPEFIPMEQRLREALEELVEVAVLRGDNDLPHPCDDPKLWTARMQEAWDDAQALLNEEVVG